MTGTPVHVGDWVLRAIEAEIAAHPPERGGALLGPPQRPVVTWFAPDPEAATTSASYRPSRALDARVKQLEQDEGLELKGIVHSHPRGLDHPSEHDAAELATGLLLNGHLARYLAPIVTCPAEGEPERHELSLPSGKISFFAGHRARSGPARVRPCRPLVIPLSRDLEAVARELGCAAPSPALSDAGTGPLLTATLALPGEVELLLLASEHYPALPPVLLVKGPGAGTEQLHVAWRLELAPEERQRAALREVFAPPGPYRRGYGPRGGAVLTGDPERARRAGWELRFGAADPDAAAEALREALFTRSGGLLSRSLRARSALVAGCGSVGSYLAEHLARAGVGRLVLLDPDRVEPVNLSRTGYEVADVGTSKPEALAARLLRVVPGLEVAAIPRAVEALEPAELDGLVRGVDLVVAATDDPAAQRTLNRFAYARGKAALFVGLYAGAQGGEVVLSVPGRTPCYRCATAARHGAERAGGRVAPEVQYGTGRLPGEVALAADIQHVTSAAVKLGLSLLLPEGSEAELRRFAERVLAEGTSYLTLSTVPGYWFYPAVFGEVAGQGAYQSVWLTPVALASCTVCGPPEQRVDPLEVPLRPPRRSELYGTDARGGGVE